MGAKCDRAEDRQPRGGVSPRQRCAVAGELQAGLSGSREHDGHGRHHSRRISTRKERHSRVCGNVTFQPGDHSTVQGRSPACARPANAGGGDHRPGHADGGPGLGGRHPETLDPGRPSEFVATGRKRARFFDIVERPRRKQRPRPAHLPELLGDEFAAFAHGALLPCACVYRHADHVPALILPTRAGPVTPGSRPGGENAPGGAALHSVRSSKGDRLHRRELSIGPTIDRVAFQAGRHAVPNKQDDPETTGRRFDERAWLA